MDEPELEGPKGFRSRIHVDRNNIGQAIASGAWRIVEFTTERYDTLGEFDNTPGNYYFRPRRPGFYLCTAQLRYTNAIPSGQYVQIGFRNPGGGFYGTFSLEGESLNVLCLSLTQILYLTPVDWVQVNTQTSIFAGSTLGGSIVQTFFMVHRLS
jgi:hypothetical protein